MLMIVVLGFFLYKNDTVRQRMLQSNSALMQSLSAVKRAMGSVTPAGRYGITKETTQLELAERLSDILLSGSYSDAEVQVLVRELRKRADFVIVGDIDTIHILEMSSTFESEGEFTIGVNVASVERGSFPYDYIEASAGYYASWLPLPIYPPHVKANYKHGDTVRIYVTDDADYGYILCGGFFGIEPRRRF